MMIDREKVIQALQCRSHASERCENPCAETGYCHYSYQIIDGSGEPIYPFICNKKQICEDAIALLKAQEPQVMSIGDLYGYDMGFYERRDEEFVWPVLISRGGPDDDETVGFVRKDGYELRSDCGLMNITWRIWTAYPPHELREATPWE